MGELNKLQMCSAFECVYYKDKSLKIMDLHRKTSSITEKNKKKIEPAHYRNAETNEEIIGLHQIDIKIKLSLSIINLKRRAKTWTKEREKSNSSTAIVIPTMDRRNKELYEIFDKFKGQGMKSIGNTIGEILYKRLLEKIWLDHFSHQYPGSAENIKENHMINFFLEFLHDYYPPKE